jgi:hypothetical protein
MLIMSGAESPSSDVTSIMNLHRDGKVYSFIIVEKQVTPADLQLVVARKNQHGIIVFRVDVTYKRIGRTVYLLQCVGLSQFDFAF